MGSFDCYCALCCGPLGIGFINFGDPKLKALRKRRKRVEVEKRRLAGEDVHEGKIEDEEDEEMEDVNEDENEGGEMEETGREGDDFNDDSDDGDDDYELSSASSSSYSSEDSITNSLDGSDSDLPIGNIEDVPGPPPEPEGERDDTWSQASELSAWGAFDPYGGTIETDRVYEEEENSYDPSMLKTKDTSWIGRCRALGFNPTAPGITKAFITGRGRYTDYGGFDVKKPGNDPNDPGDNCYNSFWMEGQNDKPPVFPFHEACFGTLARSLGYVDDKGVDKDVLYGVMNSHVECYDHSLNLEYGLAQDVGQFWNCMPGEEYSVSDPGPRPGFEEELQSMLPARLFDSASRPLDLAHKVRNDPLSMMPYDILHGIVDRLSTEDAVSLMTASWHILSSTRESAFWKHMLRVRISPWLWELKTVLTTTTLPDNFDLKGLFLWLYKVTLPKFGFTGPLMGIANRRRIWTACQPLVSSYRQKVMPDLQAEPDDDEAKAILDSAVSLHMPTVMFPRPKEAQTVSAQFFRSWNEMSHRSYDLDTYWNTDGALVGIAVTFGVHQRVFGTTDGIAGRPLHISLNDWIVEIVLSISQVDMLNEQQDRSQRTTAMDVTPAEEAGIRGMSVTLASGKTKRLKVSSRHRHQRPFVVLPDMALIGLTGQIAANGVISRLGLLQAARPGTTAQHTNALPTYQPAQKLLWSWNDAHMRYNAHANKPIWSHPNYTFHAFAPPEMSTHSIPSDMLPHQTLLWAETPSQYTYLQRISAFQVSGDITNTSRPIPHIVGLWPKKTHKHGSAPHVGTGGPVPAQHATFQTCTNPSDLKLHSCLKPFDEAHMSHFDVDGPGGEVVREVHVSGDRKALKLVTDRGRQCYWGEEQRSSWLVKRADPGEVIVGLSCCFGRLGGWSWGAKMYSHWALSDVGVITMKVEGERGET